MTVGGSLGLYPYENTLSAVRITGAKLQRVSRIQRTLLWYIRDGRARRPRGHSRLQLRCRCGRRLHHRPLAPRRQSHHIAHGSWKDRVRPPIRSPSRSTIIAAPAAADTQCCATRPRSTTSTVEIRDLLIAEVERRKRFAPAITFSETGRSCPRRRFRPRTRQPSLDAMTRIRSRFVNFRQDRDIERLHRARCRAEVERGRRARVGRGPRILLDDRGLPIDAGATIHAGSIFRLVPARAPGDTPDRDRGLARDGQSLATSFASSQRRSCTVTSTGPSAPKRCSISPPSTTVDSGPLRGAASRLHDRARCDRSRGLPRTILGDLSVDAECRGARAHCARAVARCRARRCALHRGPLFADSQHAEGLSLDEAVEAPLRGIERGSATAERLVASSSAGCATFARRVLELARLAVGTGIEASSASISPAANSETSPQSIGGVLVRAFEHDLP